MFESDVWKKRDSDAGIEQLHGHGLLKTVHDETNDIRKTYPSSLRLTTYIQCFVPKENYDHSFICPRDSDPKSNLTVLAAAAKSSTNVTIALPGSSDGKLG